MTKKNKLNFKNEMLLISIIFFTFFFFSCLKDKSKNEEKIRWIVYSNEYGKPYKAALGDNNIIVCFEKKLKNLIVSFSREGKFHWQLERDTGFVDVRFCEDDLFMSYTKGTNTPTFMIIDQEKGDVKIEKKLSKPYYQFPFILSSVELLVINAYYLINGEKIFQYDKRYKEVFLQQFTKNRYFTFEIEDISKPDENLILLDKKLSHYKFFSYPYNGKNNVCFIGFIEEDKEYQESDKEVQKTNIPSLFILSEDIFDEIKLEFLPPYEIPPKDLYFYKNNILWWFRIKDIEASQYDLRMFRNVNNKFDEIRSAILPENCQVMDVNNKDILLCDRKSHRFGIMRIGE